MRDALRHLMTRPAGDTADGPLIRVSAEPFSGNGLLYGSVSRHDTYRDALGQIHHPSLDWGLEAEIARLGGTVTLPRPAYSTTVFFRDLPPDQFDALVRISGAGPVPACTHCAGEYDREKRCSWCHGLGRDTAARLEGV